MDLRSVIQELQTQLDKANETIASLRMQVVDLMIQKAAPPVVPPPKETPPVVPLPTETPPPPKETPSPPDVDPNLTNSLVDWAKENVVCVTSGAMCSYCLARSYLGKKIQTYEPARSAAGRTETRRRYEKFYAKHAKIMLHMRIAILRVNAAIRIFDSSYCSTCRRPCDSFRKYMFPGVYFVQRITCTPAEVSRKRPADEEAEGAPPAKKPTPAPLRRCDIVMGEYSLD